MKFLFDSICKVFLFFFFGGLDLLIIFDVCDGMLEVWFVFFLGICVIVVFI